jgi:RHS repeat-associated protein
MEEIGLMYFVARWMDPYLNHFNQPDPIIPDPYNPQDWNRYAYTRFNPVINTDPSGHRACSSMEDCEDFGTTPMGRDWADLYFSKLKYPHSKSPIYLNISDNGLDFIKSQEGLYLQLYNDGNQPNDPFFYKVTGSGQGNCTIGYGHLVHTGPCSGDPREADYQNGISIKQANEMLRNDVEPAEKGVRRYVKVKLTQPQYDALVSLVFNWGIDNFRTSPKLTMLNNGDYVDMAMHLRKGPLGPNGQQYPGLVRRREAELVMFLTMVDRK